MILTVVKLRSGAMLQVAAYCCAVLRSMHNGKERDLYFRLSRLSGCPGRHRDACRESRPATRPTRAPRHRLCAFTVCRQAMQGVEGRTAASAVDRTQCLLRGASAFTDLRA